MAKQENHALESILASYWDANFSLEAPRKIAVAVSGGPDSMALLDALFSFSAKRECQVIAYTVDHQFHEAAHQEALDVGAYCEKHNIRHHILKWDHSAGETDSRVQENARTARYALMTEQMKADGISHLFLAHHMADQAETFLFRLAKGSGLDGLAAMQPFAEQGQGIILCRPLLEVSKDELVSYCLQKRIDFATDPSNEDEHYARVRLRKALPALEEEGLSAKRLSTTARRMCRARKALDNISLKSFDNSILEMNTDRIVFDLNALRELDEEILIRVVTRALAHFSDGNDYGVRMEKIETLCMDLIHSDVFRKRTLGGVIFELKNKNSCLMLSREHAA